MPKISVTATENAIMAAVTAKGKTVVAGGPVFTTGHKNFKNVDHFVLGEGEVTLPLLLM